MASHIEPQALLSCRKRSHAPQLHHEFGDTKRYHPARPTQRYAQVVDRLQTRDRPIVAEHPESNERVRHYIGADHPLFVDLDQSLCGSRSTPWQVLAHAKASPIRPVPNAQP